MNEEQQDQQEREYPEEIQAVLDNVSSMKEAGGGKISETAKLINAIETTVSTMDNLPAEMVDSFVVPLGELNNQLNAAYEASKDKRRLVADGAIGLTMIRTYQADNGLPTTGRGWSTARKQYEEAKDNEALQGMLPHIHSYIKAEDEDDLETAQKALISIANIYFSR